MAYTLVIRPRQALFRQKTDASALKKCFGNMFGFGGVDANFAFMQPPAPPSAEGEAHYMVYGAAGRLGRGFYLFTEKGGVCRLSAPTPTTTHDLEDFFVFAGMLAKRLGVKALENGEGAPVPRAGLTAEFAEVKQWNFEALHSFALTEETPYVTTVRLPLYLPASLCKRITGVPPENGEAYFSAYLAEKQQLGYRLLRPRFITNGAGLRAGVYTLCEGLPCIVPKAPYVPAGLPLAQETVAEWRVELAPKSAPPLGTVPYATFLAGLSSRSPAEFDERHLAIRGQSLRWMNELVKNVESM